VETLIIILCSGLVGGVVGGAVAALLGAYRTSHDFRHRIDPKDAAGVAWAESQRKKKRSKGESLRETW